MSPKVDFSYVYDTSHDPQKFVAFFMSDGEAERWVAKQENKSLVVSDEKPPKRRSPEQDDLDTGLDAALEAVKAEEAKNEQDRSASGVQVGDGDGDSGVSG